MATTFAAIWPTRRRSRRRSPAARRRCRPGSTCFPAQQPVPAELRRALRRLRPGVQDLRISLPSLNERDSRRHAGPRAQRRREPPPPGRLPPAREPGRAADDDDLAQRLEDLSTRPSRSPRRRSVADRLQLLELLLDAAPRAPDRARLDRLLAAGLADRQPARSLTSTSISTGAAACRRLRDGPRRGRDRPLDRRLLGLQANGKRRCPPPRRRGEFEPDELPILHANPAAPTGQNGSRLPARPDRLPARRAAAPGQGRSNPAFVVPDIPGDRGITDVYFNRDGDRALRDTRVAARQP